MKRFLPLALLAASLAGCDLFTGPDDKISVPSVGKLLTFNVNHESTCDSPVFRTGRVAAVTQHAIVVADTANPANGFTDADYQGFGEAFDNLVWPVDTGTFGEPTDIDHNGRVVIFFTRYVNDLTPQGAGFFYGGFTFSRDLFPQKGTKELGECTASNEAEMFYMLVPDPARGGPFSLSEVRRTTVGTLAHEFQHLINAARRLYVLKAGDNWEEVVWLNEGLSHVAEELTFYRASGLTPKQDIDVAKIVAAPGGSAAELSYQRSNFTRLQSFYGEPEANSPYDTDDDLATRGAIWQFLRYEGDRRPDDQAFFNGLANSKVRGMENLQAAMGSDPIPAFRDWAVSIYTDNAVQTSDSRFAQPSWNFRSVLAAIRGGTFFLKTRQLAGGATRLTLHAGGTAFLRFGVAAGARADITLSTGSGAACQTVALQVGQVFTANPGEGTHLCVDGGTGGGEYTLVPFYGARTSDDQLPLTVTSTGVQIAAGPPSPDRVPFASAAPALQTTPTFRQSTQLEMQLRDRERRELTPLIRDRGTASHAQAAATAAPSDLYVSVVRTK
ncbi:MAG: hypothetical protein JO040_03845 [Gemmatimonadetes bacterium]|nr:hypothetical protein [Gemmatimonadota bacterium]